MTYQISHFKTQYFIIFLQIDDARVTGENSSLRLLLRWVQGVA